MYSRHGHDGHERTHLSITLTGQTPGMGHIPMPHPEPFQRQPHSGLGYSNQGYPEQAYHGDLSHGGYAQYDGSHEDGGFHLQDHQQGDYDEPYQSSPQDIPLLSRPSRQTLYDPMGDQLQFLQHQPSTERFQTAAPNTNSLPTTTSTSTNKYSSEQRIDGRLYKGNLVRDCPIPPKLLEAYSQPLQSGRDEFTHMRYTAATCDPAKFIEQRYELRQTLFSKKRSTELLIVITMYNEDDLLFARTLAGVFENIEYMCNGKNKYGGSFGKEGWKQIVVCVVSDGRAKLNERTKAVLSALGVYQEGIGTGALNGQPVTSHLYEYTTRVGITVNKKTEVVETKPGMRTPVQMIFCLKEENKGKLNSHRWAFQAIGKALKGPNIVVLLDAGTRPGKTSIYQLYRAFLLDTKCGGACGEIKAMLGRGMHLALKNPVVACQNFEYKMSNLLDKPMESAFGFISVLPGAFSAYRYIALQNNKDGVGPLEKYFGGEFKHGSANIFTRNMYLAEDRILCFELIAKKDASWVLTYVKSASAETDVPESTVNLIKQRRRWLNGSLFAAIYALTHFYQIFGSSHSVSRKVMFLVEFLFQFVNLIFAWFAIGNFFLVFQILTTSLGGADLIGRTGEILSVVIEWIYFATLVTCFVLALGNKPEGSPAFYRATSWIFGGIMLYLTFALILIPYKSVTAELADVKLTLSSLFSDSVFFTLIVSLLSTYMLWIFISVVSLDAWHIITSSFQYFLLSPTYVNTINIYAFCNVHDVSWGTREAEQKKNLGFTEIGTGNEDNVDTKISAQDLDALYDAELKKFTTRAPEEAQPVLSKKAKDDFYDASFRSYVVLAWILCNAALVAIVLKSGGVQRLSDQEQIQNGAASSVVKVYLAVVLWSVVTLSSFKFVGAMWYLIKRLFHH